MNTTKLITKSIYNSLLELGLTEHEINLYTVSLSKGPLSISDLAKALKISRPNIYKLIHSLENHELVKFSSRKKYNRSFTVEPPTTVVKKIREKRKALSELDHQLVSEMPDLLALYHQGDNPTKINILQGEEQYLKVFFQILEETKDESQFLGSAKDFINLISWYQEKKWIEERLKRGISIKALVFPSEDSKTLQEHDNQEKRETRILKGISPFESSFQLFANKVIIWQPKAPLAVLIEDEYIVKMLKSMFTGLWEASI